MKHYFSSDFHFDHKNVIKHDNRPFDNIGEMNDAIIMNHNSIVKPGDNFYFLGDLCFSKRPEYFLEQLNGNLHFIKGNHDHRDTVKIFQRYGVYLGEQKKIKINQQEIVLNHFAMRVWDKMHHGTWHLYGHSHGSLPDDPNSLSFDIGCMNFDYKPLEFEQVKQIMDGKSFKPVDHHK